MAAIVGQTSLKRSVSVAERITESLVKAIQATTPNENRLGALYPGLAAIASKLTANQAGVVQRNTAVN